jgi:multidrug efflux pump subunit AcrA (membrane-fusion protein)
MLKNKFVCYLLSITACLCLCGCGKQEETKIEALIAPEKANYDTEQVEKADYLTESQGDVSIEFPKELKLSWDVEGATVKEVLVEKGQEVKAGDVLMTFQVEVDKIALEELEIQLLRKQEDYARKKDVMEVQLREAEEEAEEIVNGHSYRIAVLNVEKKRIDYEQYVYQTEKAIGELEEKVREQKELLVNTEMKAPIDGIIGSVPYSSEGEPVAVGETLITMFATDEVLLKVSRAGEKLRYNMEVVVTKGNKSNGKQYRGRVISAPNILPGTVQQDFALIALEEEMTLADYGYETKGPGRGYGFRTKMEFTAKYQELKDVLLVSKEAIRKEDGKTYVYILEDGVVHKRFVTVGLSGKTHAWILDGLREGQAVILD